MERGLKAISDVLTIILNFMAVLGLEIVADVLFGESSAPVYALWLPMLAPLVFYAARCLCRHLAVFFLIHVAVVIGLFYLGGLLPVPILWEILFTLIGLIYAVMSFVIRLKRDDYGEGEAHPGFMAAAAVLFFLCCSHLGSTEACARILWLALLWLPGHWMKSYLDNFLYYTKMNRQAAGAMPEKRILQGGVTFVAAYGIFGFAILTLYSKTTLVARLSEWIRNAGYLLLRLFFGFLSRFSGGATEEEAVTETIDAGEQMMMMFGEESTETPMWVQVLDQVLVTAVVILMIAGVIFLVFALIRQIIRGFYAGGRTKKEILREDFVEEQERLSEKKEVREAHLPTFGGTPAQRVRRIFKRTVLERTKENGGAMDAQTARELAAGCAVDAQETAQWDALTALYERARYTREAVTKEDAREAGRLSKTLLRHR